MVYPSRFVEFFGPCFWKTLHAVAHTFPEDADALTTSRYEQFFSLVEHVLPCPACGAHYSQYIRANPVKSGSRRELAEWVYDLHSDVNKRTGKKNPTFAEVIQAYEGYKSDDKRFDLEANLSRMASPRTIPTGSNTKFVQILVVLLIGLFVTYLLFKKN